MTEYSSMKFAWFFLAEYINMINVSAVATTLFFGGWRAPFGLGMINDGMFNEGWWGFLWFLLKMWSFMFLFVWVRGTLLRFRYDQFMLLGWKILIPFALVWIFVLAIFQGVQTFLEVDARPFLYGAAALAFVILLVTLYLDSRAAKRESEQLAEAPAVEAFDAFSAGYPVPPLPGQALPPSPRAARRAAAQSRVAAEITAEGTAEAHGNIATKEATDD